jgi:predicted Zn-dependent protease
LFGHAVIIDEGGTVLEKTWESSYAGRNGLCLACNTGFIMIVGSMSMKKRFCVLAFVISSFFVQAWGADIKMPPFLPRYYLPVFEADQQNLVFVKSADVNGVEQWIYATGDASVVLLIENIKCDRASSQGMFNNILGYLNTQLKDKEGEFLEITARDFFAKIYEGDIETVVFAYILPKAIQIWTYSTTPKIGRQLESKFMSFKALVNRHRYEDALSEGNISLGVWGTEVYDYATQLLRDGKKTESLSVLRNILATSPHNYAAHLDFAENTSDLAASKTSAEIVLDNAEDLELINRAAKKLARARKTYDSVPKLDKGETGLQLILIPLMPCNIWLLDKAAKIYESITDVPTKVRRLPEGWNPGRPDRIAHQRTIQGILVRLKKENIDFKGWRKERYIRELKNTVEQEDAISQYQVKDLIDKVNKTPGQHLAGPQLDWFNKTLDKYRSGDRRTMYVGITEVNIYSGDNNYVFSLGILGGVSRASILSYYMMLGEILSHEYQSSQRLTERIAKELVPASLKLLGIPRSTDPTCPYSYSSGVSRLDQKTLVLSQTVKEALKKIKLQQFAPGPN